MLITTASQHQGHSQQRFRSHNLVCYHLVFTSSDDERPVRTSDPHLQHCSTPDDSPHQGRAESLLQLKLHMDYHHISTPSTNGPFHFPTAPLDDDIWLEDTVPHRQLCIHEQSQPHYQCSYFCPCSLDLLHSTLENVPAPYYKVMDLSDILDVQDMMTTTIDEDISDLKDILVFEYGQWFG